MRLIDADALIIELQKMRFFFDNEAVVARENSIKYTDNYAKIMWSLANGIRDAIVEVYDAPTIEAVSIDDYRSMVNTCYKLQKALEEMVDRKTEPSFKVDEIGDDDPTIHAIAYLQKVGWLQEHDRALTEPNCSEQPNNCESQMGDARPIPLSNRVTHIKDKL